MLRQEMNNRRDDLVYVDTLGAVGYDDQEEDVMEEPDEAQVVGLQEEPDEKLVYTGKELLEMKITELPSLVDGILPKTGIIALAGSSDTGKSAFLRQLAGDIVCGEPQFLGFDIKATHKNVIVVSTEDDKYAVSYLLTMQNGDTRTEEVYENLRYIFNTQNLVEKLDKELKRQPADCIIIDTFSDLYGGDLNQSNKVRRFLDDYRNLCIKHECLIIFLHHTGKRTELQPPSKDHLLGSQGFESKMRLVIELRKDWTNTHKRHLCIVKGNYQKESNKQESIVLMFDGKMRYTATSEKVSFEKLVKPDPSKSAKNTAKERAAELKQTGLSISQITETMTKEGFQVKRATIGNWVRGISYPSIQPSLLPLDDGHPEEDDPEE